MFTNDCTSLTEALAANARENPDAPALMFLGEDGSRVRLTRGEFWERTGQIAAALEANGIGADEIVILVLRHSPLLPLAFFGAMRAGAVPSIFSYLTEKLDPQLYRERVKTLVAESGARAVITFAGFQAELEAVLADVDCRVLCDEDLVSAGVSESAPEPSFPANKLAFLQYTSGTTGLQKGIALTHAMVLDHVAARVQALRLRADDVVISWLPLYHDMGLISGLVTPLAVGIPTVLMSPFQWVRDPKLLFVAFDEFQGTLCWMPNFAFNHCVRAIRERDLAGIDLSRVRAIVNGAEPVRADTLESFRRRFAPYGFSPDACKTAYGMAELVQTAVLCPPDESPRVDWVQREPLQIERRAVPAEPESPDALAVVSCGAPMPRTKIRIVDETRAELPERHVGEIAISSSWMFTGYFHRAQATAAALEDGWFYSGDMGYLADGQLYVCGRKKDLIISAGRNIYPEDVEAIANAVTGVYAGRAVAFGIPDAALGSERVYLLVETRPEVGSAVHSQLQAELRQAMVKNLDIALADVRIVPRGWIGKTSNGKLARAANRDKYIQEFGIP